ncbi:MAG TPA: glycosyltransferase family 2 protein [Acidimicrobiales bacterium]|nr:glycosyltransferase family 2 protein [Acidimicrobiales bacterium]
MSEGTRRRLVSVVVPVLNEEDNIPRLEKELLAALEPIESTYEFEFIVVDNDSTDSTSTLVKDLCRRDDRWRYVRFSRNFSIEASLTAGYRVARGDAIVVLYSDLQDPPEAIRDLLAKWEEGWDVVYGVRTVREGDPRWRNAGVHLAYRAISRLSDVRIPPNVGDFRLITRQVRDALDQCTERNRYTRGLIAWLGFRQVGVPYERQPRRSGESKMPLVALVVFVFTAITSFSLKPLRLFTIFGFVMLGVSLLALPIYVWLFLTGNPPQGITTVVVLLLLVLAVNSLGVGVLGEYLGRTHAETKARPLYIVAEVLNLDPVASRLVPPRDLGEAVGAPTASSGPATNRSVGAEDGIFPA